MQVQREQTIQNFKTINVEYDPVSMIAQFDNIKPESGKRMNQNNRLTNYAAINENFLN